MAKTSHLSGHKLEGFKAENLRFKPNIGDLGAGFWGIRINPAHVREKRIRLSGAVCRWVPVTGKGTVDRST